MKSTHTLRMTAYNATSSSTLPKRLGSSINGTHKGNRLYEPTVAWEQFKQCNEAVLSVLDARQCGNQLLSELIPGWA